MVNVVRNPATRGAHVAPDDGVIDRAALPPAPPHVRLLSKFFSLWSVSGDRKQLRAGRPVQVRRRRDGRGRSTLDLSILTVGPCFSLAAALSPEATGSSHKPVLTFTGERGNRRRQVSGSGCGRPAVGSDVNRASTGRRAETPECVLKAGC